MCWRANTESTACSVPAAWGSWSRRTTWGSTPKVAVKLRLPEMLETKDDLWLAAPKPAEPSAPVARLALGPAAIAVKGAW